MTPFVSLYLKSLNSVLEPQSLWKMLCNLCKPALLNENKNSSKDQSHKDHKCLLQNVEDNSIARPPI